METLWSRKGKEEVNKLTCSNLNQPETSNLSLLFQTFDQEPGVMLLCRFLLLTCLLLTANVQSFSWRPCTGKGIKMKAKL